MNLLLLLSALLSALSGTAGARAPATPATPAALTRSVASAVKATAAARLQVAARPVLTIGGPAVSVAPALRSFALPDPIPAFASRRRE